MKGSDKVDITVRQLAIALFVALVVGSALTYCGVAL